MNAHRLAASDLAETLGIPLEELRETAANMGRYVRCWTNTRTAKPRPMRTPHGLLRQVQASMSRALLKPIPQPDYVHGYVRKRTPVTGAAPHVGRPYVLAVDIENCFPSVTREHVLRVWKDLGWSSDAANLLTRLTTWDGCLPQGFVTSNELSNLVLAPLDRGLYRLAQDHSLTYTRYADNITFSGEMPLEWVYRVASRIADKHGFHLKPARVARTYERQEITKLIVNEKINPTREHLGRLRRDLRRCVRGGLEQVAPPERNRLRQSLRSRIGYVRSINPLKAKPLERMLRSTAWGKQDNP